MTVSCQHSRSSGKHGIHVVGGGLTGYAAALALADHGYSVRLYHRDEESADPLRTTTINPVAYGFLKSLGVMDAAAGDTPLAETLAPIDRILVTDDIPREKPLDTVINWDKPETGPLAWVVRNHDLTMALHALVEASPLIECISARITDYHPQHPDYGHAAAGLITDQGETIPAGLILAADGRNSALRQAASLRVITRNLHQTAIVAILSLDAPHQNMAWQKFLPGGPMALMPMPEPQLASLVWSMKTEDAAQLMEVDDDRFAMALDDVSGKMFGGLRLASPKQAFPIIPQHAVWPVATRLALLGDAGHAINPLAGQGYNLALGDIMTLRDVLNTAGDTGGDIGGATVLKTYARRRWPEVVMMTMATDGLNMLFSFGKRRRRLAGMGMAVANLPPIKALAEKLASGRMFNRG